MTTHANRVTSADFPDKRIGKLPVPEEYVQKHILADGPSIYESAESFIEDGGANMAAHSRYLTYCILKNNGNIIDTISEYYLGADKLLEYKIRAGNPSYFDSDEPSFEKLLEEYTSTEERVTENTPESLSVRGYSHQIPERLRKLIEATAYIYSKTVGNAEAVDLTE
jgi:hypothetical protein